MLILHLTEEKEKFKKRQNRYLWISSSSAANESLTIVSLDESFFFYDSLVRSVWIEKKRPIVRITGSHKHTCIFGDISMEGKQQLFRQYDVFNGDTFLDFIHKIHAKFPKCYLFMDKASPHYKSKKVQSTLKKTRIL